MNRIFGTKKKENGPTLNQVIESSDARASNIEAKVRKLDAELVKYREQMSKMRDGPGKNAIKQRALRVLQQKKLYEGQMDQVMQQTFTLEQASIAQDNLKNTMVMLDTMKTTTKALKSQYGKINVDKIEKMQDEMEDLLEQANDVQEIMSRSYGVPNDIDEDELQAELDALGDEVFETEAPAYLTEDVSLPSVPEPAAADKSELKSEKIVSNPQ